MTITFPRQFPAWFPGMQRCVFKPYRIQELDPTGSGDPLVRDLGPDLCDADYRSGKLSPERMLELETWLETLENGGKTFWGYDFRRPLPLLYPNGFAGMSRAGGGSFDGTCTLENVTDNKVISLSGLSNGFQFSIGDYLAFLYLSGSHAALHRIVAPATAASDGTVDVEVRTHVRPGWAEEATVNLVKPSCVMKLVPESYQPDQQRRGRGQISFKSRQTLLVPA